VLEAPDAEDGVEPPPEAVAPKGTDCPEVADVVAEGLVAPGTVVAGRLGAEGAVVTVGTVVGGGGSGTVGTVVGGGGVVTVGTGNGTVGTVTDGTVGTGTRSARASAVRSPRPAHTNAAAAAFIP
jgi:hypothetical protein